MAIVTTWPLALDWRTALPRGSESVATVPLFNLWSLRWNADRIAHFGQGYWDAPIFAPLTGTFARSEPQPLTGIVAWILHPIGGDVGSYNLTLWFLLVTNAMAATYLARRLGAPFGAALLTGVLAQTLPFTFNELGVLQLVPLGAFWFMLERLVAYRASPTPARLGGAAAGWVVLVLTSGYYALFAVVLFAVVAPWFVLPPRRPWRRRGIDALAAIVVVGVVAGPFLWSQQGQTADESWDPSTIHALSADANDWLQHSELALRIPLVRERSRGQALFPGIVLLALATAGVVIGARANRRVTFAALAGAVTMFVISFGLRVSLFGWRPYSALREHVPGFDRLRSPFRAAAVTQAMLVVVAIPTIAWLWRRPVGRFAAIVLVALAAVETVHWDQPTARVPAVATLDWVDWLEDAPNGAVAMVPFPPDGHVENYEETTIAMLASLEHGHPLLNGYTGLFPDSYRELRRHLELFPVTAGESMSALNASVARYVVLRDDIADHAEAELVLARYGWTKTFDGNTRDIWTRPSVPAP